MFTPLALPLLTLVLLATGVFSMDGDIAPLGDIVRLAKKYGAYTFVGELSGSRGAATARAMQQRHARCFVGLHERGERGMSAHVHVAACLLLRQTSAMQQASWGRMGAARQSTAVWRARWTSSTRRWARRWAGRQVGAGR